MKHAPAPPARFLAGRRYFVIYKPADARSRTDSFTGNYMGVSNAAAREHAFDLRPNGGTAWLHEDFIVSSEDVGPAIWERR